MVITESESLRIKKREKVKKHKKIFCIHFFIFMFAFFLNLIWETLHQSLYISSSPMPSLFGFILYQCAFRDALLILLMYWIICFETQDWFWIVDVKKHVFFVMVLGILLSIVIELQQVYVLHDWSYTASMPLLPFIPVGISPVVQLIVTPLLTFFATQAFYRSKPLK